MRGEIDSAELEKAQQRYSGDFTDVVLRLAKHEQKQRLTNSFLALLIVLIMLIIVAALLLYGFQLLNIHNPVITIIISFSLVLVSFLVTPIKHSLVEAQQKRDVRHMSMSRRDKN